MTSESPLPKRIVWLTPDQRTHLQDRISAALQDSDLSEEQRGHLFEVSQELKLVSQRERISGRLVSNHVTGLMLPHDALPVRVTDPEAEAVLAIGIADKKMKRMLETGPRKQGRR